MSAKRSVYTDLEKQIFLDILKKYKHTIESGYPTTKEVWSNLKQQSRNVLTSERQSRFLTGGGPEDSTTNIDPAVLDILPSLMVTAHTIASSNFSKEETLNYKTKVARCLKENNNNIENIFVNKIPKKRKEEVRMADENHYSDSDLDDPPPQTLSQDTVIINGDATKRKTTVDAKKIKIDRISLICSKEAEFADIRIANEMEINNLKKNHEEAIFKLNEEKIRLDIKEAQQRLKLSKFRAINEMGADYLSDSE
ncbi:uncharacterized protein [Prorops nasuta]|uniref:uncharacterized protein isoform X2 n=1 Tax=Prorops nasuta TaxID=863751 RepID=UPI0034CDE216